jgi:hypothetical protein
VVIGSLSVVDQRVLHEGIWRCEIGRWRGKRVTAEAVFVRSVVLRPCVRVASLPKPCWAVVRKEKGDGGGDEMEWRLLFLLFFLFNLRVVRSAF